MLRTTTLTSLLALSLTACIQSGGGGGGGSPGPAPAGSDDLAQALATRVEQNLSILDDLLSIARELPLAEGLEMDDERPDVEEMRAWLGDEANIESRSGATVVYRVRPEEMCDPELDPPECISEAERNPVRVLVTRGEPMRIEVQVGEGGHTVVTVALAADGVVVSLEVAEAAKALLETSGDAPIRLDQAAGSLRLAVRRVAGGAEIEATVEGLSIRGALDGEAFSLVAREQRATLALTREGDAPAMTAAVLLAGLEASFPVCEAERCETLGFEVPRIETAAGTVGEVITIAWKQAGAIEALLDGARLFGYELADTQVTLTPTDAGIEAVFEPGIDLAVEVKASQLVDLIGDEILQGDEPPRDELLTVTFDGAATPTLSIEEAVTRIVAGTLRFASSSEGTAFEASAPACLGEPDDVLAEVACP